MSNLSDSLRKSLGEKFCLNKPAKIEVKKSIDGTMKYSIQLHDKNSVEAVLIPSKKRITFYHKF